MQRSKMTTMVSIGSVLLFVAGSMPVRADDCNSNGIPDDQDIAAGTSQDCNTNGIPDEYELASIGTWDYNPETGDWYRLTADGAWHDAEHEAMCLGGHLVTVNSPGENQWLVDRFSSIPGVDNESFWIGFTDEDIEGTWIWACDRAGDDCGGGFWEDREPGSTSYVNWTPGEPNNTGGSEHWAHLYVRDDGGPGAGLWNDKGNPPDYDPERGIVERPDPPPADCNSNGILDEYEPDCDGDGAIDDCDDDIDDDGVLNPDDACDYTPPEAPIVTDSQDPLYGTLPYGDLDGDCDCDLEDFALMQIVFTGPACGVEL